MCPDRIDSRWSDPIGDELITYVRGYERISIIELSRRTQQAVVRAKSNQ